jgi:glycosyltransferase involved in cell wall biosynthesis
MAADLTIAIPSFQRCAQLSDLLESVRRAVTESGTSDVEVVVVLDGSSDGSREMVDGLATTFPVPLLAKWQPNAGRAATRNALVALTTTSLVWLVDDDMTITASALVRHLGHDRTATAVLMGPCDVVADQAEHQRLSFYYDRRHQRLEAIGRVTRPQDCSFANTSAPTALLATHRFDERFIGYGLEDSELAVRLLAAGVDIGFDVLAAIDHYSRPTPGARLTSMREAGRNMVRFVAVHPDHQSVAFEPDVPRSERVMRCVARPHTSAALWAAATVVQRVGAWRGDRRGGWRLRNDAELLALYAGVAQQGGTPGRRPPHNGRLLR